MKARFVGGPEHGRVMQVSVYEDGEPPDRCIRREPVRTSISHWPVGEYPPAQTYETREHRYRLIGVRDGVAVYMHEEAALEAAENYGKRRCVICGEMHDASFTRFGVPLMGCPRIADLPGSPQMAAFNSEQFYGRGLADLLDMQEALLDRYGIPAASVLGPQAEVTTATADALKKAVDGIAKAMSKRINTVTIDGIDEPQPNGSPVNLNDAQRQFIRDVGTRAAYADGGKRLAELADAPEPNGGAASNTHLYIGTAPDSRAAEAVESAWEKIRVAESKNVAPTGDGRLKVEAPGEAATTTRMFDKFGKRTDDETAAVAYLDGPAEMTPEQRKERGVLLPDTWVCTNHPAGLEITYPATTPKCEVCGKERE
jgi:hypothetical protein